MSTPTSDRLVGGNRAKTKSISGWKAFDLKQRRKQHDLESNNDSEAYPSLSGQSPPQTQSLFIKYGAPLEKPFSSAVVASMDFPSLMEIKNRNLEGQVPASISVKNTKAADAIKAYQKLNYLHPWADKSLIQDVLVGVNNNADEALSLLEAMLICENEDGKNKQVASNSNNFTTLDILGTALREKEGKSFTNDHVKDSYKQSRASIQLIDAAKSLPVISEPEWEEDGIYLIHRKDAIRMTRSASRYSKAANYAHIRGDHTAAHRFSLKAQQEWDAAEKLNTKAAKEIRNVLNCNNDIWTLDLHGLHAKEAVEALHERLRTIESLDSPYYLATQNTIQKQSGKLLSPSMQSTSQFEIEKVGRHHQTYRQRTTLLQVITGKGNHSRGTAALPSAIRNFLNENGYCFDERRPGVIMIRPKFRHW